MYWSREHRIQLLTTTQHPLEMNRRSFLLPLLLQASFKSSKIHGFFQITLLSHVNRGGYACIPYRVIHFSESMFLIVKEALLGLGKPYKTSVKQNKLPLIHLTCGCVVVCKNCSNAASHSPCFCVCFAKIAPMPPHKALAFVFFFFAKSLQCLLIKSLLLCLFCTWFKIFSHLNCKPYCKPHWWIKCREKMMTLVKQVIIFIIVEVI